MMSRVLDNLYDVIKSNVHTVKSLGVTLGVMAWFPAVIRVNEQVTSRVETNSEHKIW